METAVDDGDLGPVTVAAWRSGTCQLSSLPPSGGSENDSPARLEQFDRIFGRIVDYNLRSARAGYDFIRTKGHASRS